MSTSTPWGPSQGKMVLAHGIIQYSTAGHGGIHVCPSLNAQIHEAWREDGGWYEEDVDWAVVAFHFPALFKSANHAQALNTIRNYKPHQYTEATGQPVTLEESHVLREEAFREANRQSIVSVAAWGDWHKAVPKGMVGVAACMGGRNERGFYSDTIRYFLVPAGEYRDRDRNSGTHFVVDLKQHQEVKTPF